MAREFKRRAAHKGLQLVPKLPGYSSLAGMPQYGHVGFLGRILFWRSMGDLGASGCMFGSLAHQ